MTDVQKKSIEQLWYTWSEVGLSTVHAGFRIRAASEGLSDIYSERVKTLDRYTRYVLPPGTDRYAITPEQTPVCLAFMRTDTNEHILMHKQYTGLDGVGRPGNFFTHLFALGERSDEFSAADAIWLWNSPIWKTSDAELDRRSVKLGTVSIGELEKAQTFYPEYTQVQQVLPFFIEAYLSRQEPRPIYLAAPAGAMEMIVNLIVGLTLCLPQRLLTGLTFSTYEPDWSKATTQLVGVSWLPRSGNDDHPESGFTPQFYREQLALNCATGEYSPLERHPLARSNPLAAQFAQFATECLVYNAMEQLEELIEQAEQDPMLDVDMFLRLYKNLVVDKEHLLPRDIEEYLNSPFHRILRLRDHTFRKQVIDLVTQDRQWWRERLQPLLLKLLKQGVRERSARRTPLELSASLTDTGQHRLKKVSAQVPRSRGKKRSASAIATGDQEAPPSLEHALSRLAKSVIPIIITTMKHPERHKSTAAIASLLELMDSTLAVDDPYGMWKSLRDSILASEGALLFLTQHWEIYSWLLKKWDGVLPVGESEEIMRPVLVILWSHLGAFLALHVRMPWVMYTLDWLLRNTSGLTPSLAQQLEQNYAAEFNTLLESFAQEPKSWPVAVPFVITLIEKGYPGKQQYDTLVEELLTQLIRYSQWHPSKDLVVALTASGYGGSDSYMQQVELVLKYLLHNSKEQLAGLDLLDKLARSIYPGKKNLVPIMLNAPLHLGGLESVLERLFPTLEELNDFFVSEGRKYLSTAEQRDAMLSVYQKLLPLSSKLRRLFVLLDASIEENYVFRVWKIAELVESSEIAAVIKSYGPRYLRNYQQGPLLAKFVIDNFDTLVKHGYSVKELLFSLFTPTKSDLMEALLVFAQPPQLSMGDIQALFKEYGTQPQYISFFIRSPIVLSLLTTLVTYFDQPAMPVERQQQFSTEKMALLLCWLNPQMAIQLRLSVQDLESILQAANPHTQERVQFLEMYGEAYVRSYPQWSLLMTYVKKYLKACSTQTLSRPTARKFLLFLGQQETLCAALDQGEQIPPSRWATLVTFLESPSTSLHVLTKLGTSLFYLLPLSASSSDGKTLMPDLAKAFAACVVSVRDLDAIMQIMKAVPLIKNNHDLFYHLLYTIAEYAGEASRRLSPDKLVPYIVFALTCSLEEQTPKWREHFAMVFLDTLLPSTSEITTWKRLDALLTAQQTALPASALERWRSYLRGLRLLKSVQGDQQPVASIAQAGPSIVSNAVSPAQPKQQQRASSTKAEREMSKALESRKIDHIASVWGQSRKELEQFYQDLPKNDQERIKVTWAFVNKYNEALQVEKGISHLGIESRLAELREQIDNLGLECTKKQRKRLLAASLYMAQVLAEQQQAEQQLNPPEMHARNLPYWSGEQPRTPSGHLPQSSSPVSQQSAPAGPEPHLLPGMYSFDVEQEHKSGFFKLPSWKKPKK